MSGANSVAQCESLSEGRGDGSEEGTAASIRVSLGGGTDAAGGGDERPPSTDVATALKKRRIKFNANMDLLLLKSVTMADAHVAPHGEAQTRFTNAVELFLSSLPSQTFNNIQKPSWKTLNDRFKRIVQDHRDAVKRNVSASGISEVRGEREELLDDVVASIDEFEESRRAERDEQTDLDRRLKAAGENIRNLAVSRSSTADQSGTSPELEENDGTTPERKGCKRRIRAQTGAENDEDEDRALFREHINEQRETEKKRLKIAEEQLLFDKETKCHERELQERRDRVSERRLELDEQRLRLDQEKSEREKEERKAASNERMKFVELMGALVKKLQ